MILFFLLIPELIVGDVLSLTGEMRNAVGLWVNGISKISWGSPSHTPL